MSYFKIDSGAFFLLSDEEGKKLEKEQWRYKLDCLNGPDTVFDFDKDRVRPYVKDYLNRRWASLESRLLGLAVLMSVLAFAMSVYSASKANSSLESLKTVLQAQSDRQNALDLIRKNGQ